MTTQPTPTAMRFGRRVHRARQARGWTQQALARSAKLTAAKVSRIEAGLARIDFVDAEAIASALSIPPSILTGWTTTDPPVRSLGGSRLTPAPSLRVAALPQGRAQARPDLHVVATAAPSHAPIRVAGLAVMPRAVHAVWCGHTPRSAVVGHPELRECTGCGVAVEGRLSQEPTTARAEHHPTEIVHRTEPAP